MKFSKNENGRDFVVGDIHGCYAKLIDKLNEVEFDFSKDRLFAVGDLVDRGPDSAKVVRMFSQHPFYSCLGNHEDMMILALKYKASVDHWFLNGGGWSIEENKSDLDELLSIVETFPLYMTVQTDGGDVGICHTDPPSDWREFNSVNEDIRQRCLWGRQAIKAKSDLHVDNVEITIHGHTPIENKIRVGNMIFIDTGAVYGGELTFVKIQG